MIATARNQSRVSFAQLPQEQDSESYLREAVRTAVEALGGLHNFVSPGNRVLLKPNQTNHLPHKSGSTTSPPLIRVLVRLCFEAGAKEVWVAESAGHAQNTRNVVKKTGLAAAVQDTGAHLIYLDEIAEKIGDFGEDAGPLRWMPAPEILERADVLINVPKAKTHFLDPISCACMNWVGLTPASFRLWLQREGQAYYRGNALFLRRFPPTLNIVDGAWAGEGQGPGANDPFWWGWIIASADPVATDVAVCHYFGLPWEELRMARHAGYLGLGQFDADDIEVVGRNVDQAHVNVKPAEPSCCEFPCRVIVGDGPGARLEGTLGHWKSIADGWRKYGVWKLLTLRGTPTFMIGEAEDPDFEIHLKEGPYIVLDDAALDKYKYDKRVTFIPGSPVPQSYMQNEMVEALGLGAVYKVGRSVEEMIQQIKGRLQARA